MPQSQRIKGQEISIIIVNDNVVETELTDFQDFNSETMLEIISKGYLGMKTELKDSIYKGDKGDFTFHVHSDDVFRYEQAIKDKARRDTPDTVFNISQVFNFPNGQTVTVLYPDVSFGAISKNTSERASYYEVKQSFECSSTEVTFG